MGAGGKPESNESGGEHRNAPASPQARGPAAAGWRRRTREERARDRAQGIGRHGQALPRASETNPRALGLNPRELEKRGVRVCW